MINKRIVALPILTLWVPLQTTLSIGILLKRYRENQTKHRSIYENHVFTRSDNRLYDCMCTN